MRVLVACEHTGTVRDAFRSRGHDAWSADLLPSQGPHHHGDVRDILHDGWDLMIAHPPCTHLAASGAGWTSHHPRRKQIGVRYGLTRVIAQRKDLDFVRELLTAPIERIAVENPVSVISTRIRPPDQTIQPWMFGHPEAKATCLWLKNLPTLRPTLVILQDRYVNQTPSGQNRLPPTGNRGLLRARTYPGIADAMADQWGTP
jgi:hypothetical protein